MLNTLDFLDALGRGDVAVDNADIFESAVASLSIDLDQKKALLAKDENALRDALGGRTPMMIQVWAPRSEPARKEEPGRSPNPSDPPRPGKFPAPKDEMGTN